MVLPVGIEPTLHGYQPSVLPIELWKRNLEQVMRIELTSSAWKAAIIPLYYTCIFLYNFNKKLEAWNRVLNPSKGHRV